jgi:hypothetical protein
MMSGSFQAKFLNIFNQYQLPRINTDTVRKSWKSTPTVFWQNQLNFALWCATSGCGVSRQEHLEADDKLICAMYTFHAYYTIRRILEQLQAPLPQDKAFDPVNNQYNQREYEKVCAEFGVSPHTKWTVKGPNGGLGRVFYMKGGQKFKSTSFGSGNADLYEPQSMPFSSHFIEQDMPGVKALWNTFILDTSKGITHPGVERINEAIRTYVWALLGAQSQTRSSMVGVKGFDAQKQFKADVDDAIANPRGAPSQIQAYENVLRFAGSKVNFSFGQGLYMAPSNMLLHIGQIVGYNNEIVIATPSQTLGVNKTINDMPVPITEQTDRAEPDHPKTEPDHPKTEPDSPTIKKVSHEDEKTALVVGGIAVGLLVLWLS